MPVLAEAERAQIDPLAGHQRHRHPDDFQRAVPVRSALGRQRPNQPSRWVAAGAVLRIEMVEEIRVNFNG